jgi:hypothetical protein
MIDNLEHISFIEGLLFYIAMQYGDKETLMEFLKIWGKEYKKLWLEDSGVHGDA